MLPSNLRAAIAAVMPVLRGWEGKVERPFRMADLIMREKPSTVVEIGVFGGQSFIPQALALKALGQGRIYGIDPFNLKVIAEEMADYDDKVMWLKQDMNVVLTDTFTMIKELELQDYATLILAKSLDVASLFRHGDMIDILHVDGGHTEQAALNDVEAYTTAMPSGGHIWMDDTHFPSLKPALAKLEEFAELVDDFGCYGLYRVK